MRIGIVVDHRETVPGYVAEIIERLAHSNSISSQVEELLIIPVASDSVAKKRLADSIFETIIKIEQRLFPNPFKISTARVGVHDTKLDEKAQIVQTAYTQGQRDLRQEITKLNLDYLVVLECPPSEVPQSCLDVPLLGVLRIAPSADKGKPRLPLALSSVLTGKSTTQISLQLSSQKHPQPIDVESAQIATEFSWTRNRDKALATVPDLVLRFLQRQNIHPFHAEPDQSNLRNGSSLLNIPIVSPTIVSQLNYVFKLMSAAISRKVVRPAAIKVRRLFGKREPGYWTVRFGKLCDEPRVWTPIPMEPTTRWAADPFLLKYQDSKFVLFEDWDVDSRMGTISAINVNSPGDIFLVLEEPFHLSYPFTFFRNDTWYLIPETNQSGAVKLYRLEFEEKNVEFRAVFLRNLLEGEFVDPTVVRVGSKDFLLVNPKKTYSQHFNEALDVFVTDDITAEHARLVPHPLNPVEIDPTTSRNAGRAIPISRNSDGEQLVKRYSQKCDLIYGEDLVENVISIDEESYRRVSSRVMNKNTFAKRVHNFDFDEEFGTMDFYFDH